jgi:hypothetical protein
MKDEKKMDGYRLVLPQTLGARTTAPAFGKPYIATLLVFSAFFSAISAQKAQALAILALLAM